MKMKSKPLFHTYYYLSFISLHRGFIFEGKLDLDLELRNTGNPTRLTSATHKIAPSLDIMKRVSTLPKEPKTVSNAACYARFQTYEALKKSVSYMCIHSIPFKKNTSYPDLYIFIESKALKKTQ